VPGFDFQGSTSLTTNLAMGTTALTWMDRSFRRTVIVRA